MVVLSEKSFVTSTGWACAVCGWRGRQPGYSVTYGSGLTILRCPLVFFVSCISQPLYFHRS